MTVRAGAQPDLHLDRRVAAAVEDLARVHPLDLAHGRRPAPRPGDGSLSQLDTEPPAVIRFSEVFGALYSLQSVTTYPARHSVLPVHFVF